jgi:hypothetical protein
MNRIVKCMRWIHMKKEKNTLIKNQEEKDRNLRRQKKQIESRIDYLIRKYPDYKGIIEDWRNNYGKKK